MSAVIEGTAVDADLAKALELHRDGAFAEAEHLYRRLLAAGPNFTALLQLGVMRLQQSRPTDALKFTQVALELNPDSAEAYANLGAAFQVLQRYAEAVAAYEAALLRDSDSAEAHYGLATAFQAQSRLDDAIAPFRRALSIDPDYAEALCGLAICVQAQNRLPEAIECYEKALAIDPDYPEALNGLGTALHAKSHIEEAILCYEKALAVQPHYIEALNNLGLAHQAMSRYVEALNCFDQLLAINRGHVSVWLNRGFALQEIGRMEEARQSFETAVDLDPQNPRNYFALVNVARVTPGDARLLALEVLARDAASTPADKQVHLHFALGKAHADLDEQELSFGHYLEGNRLQRQLISYDEAAVLETLARVQDVFTPQFLREKAGAGNPSTLPVFIVGMPRSGSTLVEQILASHPDVSAIGERDDFWNAVVGAGLDSATAPYPASVLSAKPEQLKALSAAYLSDVNAIIAAEDKANASRRAVDKTLVHFACLGLIVLTFPQAKIIHIKRNPVDTCLSCFSKLFSDAQRYSYDLRELGHYYGAYARLMAYWRGVLPEGMMLEVQYEELVEEFEPQTRRIVAHCGLEWNEACLSFYKTQRPVRTASVTQVREPVYRRAIKRWRPDAALLAPLLNELPADGWKQ